MMGGFSMLWNPAAACERAARASLAAPLLLLGFANTLPHYGLFYHFGVTRLVQARLDTTPGGMYPSSVFFFLALTWAAPFLLALLLLFGAWLLEYYVGFFLDSKVTRSEMRRLAAWGALPLAVQGLLAGAIVLLCRESCDPFNPLATNVAFFFNSKETSIFAYELLRGVELFNIWAIAITGRAIAARYERSTPAVCLGVAVLYFAAVFIRAQLLG